MITLYFFLFLPPMSKRANTEFLPQEKRDGQPFHKVSGIGSRREQSIPDEMGEFEDAWEDEIESDEDVTNAEDGDGEDGVSSSK